MDIRKAILLLFIHLSGLLWKCYNLNLKKGEFCQCIFLDDVEMPMLYCHAPGGIRGRKHLLYQNKNIILETFLGLKARDVFLLFFKVAGCIRKKQYRLENLAE